MEKSLARVKCVDINETRGFTTIKSIVIAMAFLQEIGAACTVCHVSCSVSELCPPGNESLFFPCSGVTTQRVSIRRMQMNSKRRHPLQAAHFYAQGVLPLQLTMGSWLQENRQPQTELQLSKLNLAGVGFGPLLSFAMQACS